MVTKTKRVLKPCGTWAAAMRHFRNGGIAAVRGCRLCSDAWTEHNTVARRTKRGNKPRKKRSDVSK